MRGTLTRWCLSAVVVYATVVVACRGSDGAVCPTPTVDADPQAMPEGTNKTTVFVAVNEPDAENGRDVVTKLYADSGTFDDPFARVTTYSCAHDVIGLIQLCVDARYSSSENNGDDGEELVQTEQPGIVASDQYLRRPHAYISNPDDCLETDCVTVTCPERKNVCPVVSSLTAIPSVIPDGQSTALIEVSAEDPDDGPERLVTTLTAAHGTFADLRARKTTYTCDPEVGGTIEICVVASDGDESCNAQRCTTVDCPGPLPDNICPVIEDLTATPVTIRPGQTQSAVRVHAFDPDSVNPEPLVTRLFATTGVFDDVNARETLYTCGAPGDAEICVLASDGDPTCNRTRCTIVQCPSTIPVNLCPSLYILNAIPSVIPDGQNTTRIEVRARDLDDKLSPLVTTLRASRGSFDDVSAENAVYTCAGPGEVEICADSTDGACMKTACIGVFCPEE